MDPKSAIELKLACLNLAHPEADPEKILNAAKVYYAWLEEPTKAATSDIDVGV